MILSEAFGAVVDTGVTRALKHVTNDTIVGTVGDDVLSIFEPV